MIRKAAIAALAWVLLSAFSEPLPEGFMKTGDNVTLTRSGFIFPPSLLGFNSGNEFVRTYDGKAGKDASVGYNYYSPARSDKTNTPDIAATIFVYPFRSEGEFANNGAKVNAENALSISDISAAHHNTLRDLVSQPVKGKCGSKDILGAYNSFNVDFSTGSNQGKTLPGEVYIFIQADWVIKFRFTSNQKSTDTTLKFVKSFFKANENHTSCT